jgi:hypothetical protein
MCFGCISQKTTKSKQVSISENFIDSNSLSIRIEYHDILSCIDDEPLQRIIINIKNNISTIFVFNSIGSKRLIGPILGSVLPEVNSFEKKAQEIFFCGGYDGGHGIKVKLKINGEENNFSFCKNNWDGISELLMALGERETK